MKPTKAPPGRPADTNTAMKSHPLADLVPLLEGAPFDELVEDIRARGLVHPVVVFEGKILDGRNRWRACKAAKVDWLLLGVGDAPRVGTVRAAVARARVAALAAATRAAATGTEGAL